MIDWLYAAGAVASIISVVLVLVLSRDVRRKLPITDDEGGHE